MASLLQIQWQTHTSTDLTLHRRRSLKRATPKTFTRRVCNSVVRRCSTSSPEAVEQLIRNDKEEIERRGEAEQEQDQLVYLLSENGWNVRRLENRELEMRKAAEVQAEAFHEPSAIFDDVFFEFFKAEVLAGLIYKLKHSPPNRYACLVAESDATESGRNLVGVVDVTALYDSTVLQHLEGADEYLYVSGLAVSKSHRRRKVATALLRACDVLAYLWGFEGLALRAYEDDLAARKLYTNAGYQVVSGDPPWTTTWIGRKRRILMVKQCRTPQMIPGAQRLQDSCN